MLQCSLFQLIMLHRILPLFTLLLLILCHITLLHHTLFNLTLLNLNHPIPSNPASLTLPQLYLFHLNLLHQTCFLLPGLSFSCINVLPFTFFQLTLIHQIMIHHILLQLSLPPLTLLHTYVSMRPRAINLLRFSASL